MSALVDHLLDFIDYSKTAFQTVEQICNILKDDGFLELNEEKQHQIKAGGKYFVIRNGSAVIAFKIPLDLVKGFHIVASHNDSPCFKIKQNPEMVVEEHYVKLNVEKYGGMILSSWMDRPLSVAGRIVYEENHRLLEKNISINEDLLVIPNVAIHMNREINKGYEYNPQKDMLPLLGTDFKKEKFLKILAKEAKLKVEQILDYDLFLYVTDKARIIGGEKELILAPRLDDLACVFTSLMAFKEAKMNNKITVFASFDNEEVGSTSRQGADSVFLTDILDYIKSSLCISELDYGKIIKNSFLISADNAHAIHPNHPEYGDPTNRPYLNEGIVIKYHAGQKYATDSISAARMKQICMNNEIPYQTFWNRSDFVSGSTLGNYLMKQMSIPGVDIGLPQLAMHSAVETIGVKDVMDTKVVIQKFYEDER